MAFLRECFEKHDHEKKSADDKKQTCSIKQRNTQDEDKLPLKIQNFFQEHY